ncbi:MAG: hypothetical protein QOD77_1778 [Thermoplasmata archaeon]|nr:hypothetical protein [Thermoplasmata archaeon]
MAERRLRYPLLWLAFSAVMLTGAALLSSHDGALQAWGIAVLAFPLVALGTVTAAYYLLERFRSSD